MVKRNILGRVKGDIGMPEQEMGRAPVEHENGMDTKRTSIAILHVHRLVESTVFDAFFLGCHSVGSVFE